MFLPVDPPTPAPVTHDEAQHHLPDVRLPPGLRCLVLPQRRHLLYRQDWPLYSLQLRVSAVFYDSDIFYNFKRHLFDFVLIEI